MARHRDISPARLTAIKTWLTEQGIDPATVPIDAFLDFKPTADGIACTLRYDAYVHENGRLKLHPKTGEPIREERVHQVVGPVPEFPTV